MSIRDYLASHVVAKSDRLDYGVVGMKWGQRRSSSQLKAAAKARAQTDHVQKAASKPAGPETSAARYSRLKAAAAAGQGKNMSDEDLKFFNARTEALKKVDALNKTNPGWLSKTSKKVIQSTAEKQLQAISDAIANKYISGPIVDNIGKHVPKEAAQAAADAASKK